MNRKTFRLVVFLAAISIGGILFIQIFWMGKAFDLSNKQFEHNVNLALLNVTSTLCEINQNEILPDPIEQLSSNYFIVNLNNKIAPEILETILKSEFQKREIAEDFEYGVFDCTNREMVYGRYINLKENTTSSPASSTFPQLNKDAYYFGVYFPNKTSTLAGEMWIWGFSSIVLLIVVVFFGYTLLAIFRQKKLSEIQKDFINNMTHEFKTPISTIALSSDVLQSKEIANQPERLSQYAQIIKKEATRLQNQVDRVLQMATVEKNTISLTKQELNLNELIDQSIQSAQLNLPNGGQISFDNRAKETILSADKVHLTNIIYNLLDNALKYNENIPKVAVSTHSDKNTLTIIIKDNGQGIDKKEQDLIFKKFYRVPTGNVHNVKGFGLGLYYVKMIVEAHKGRISLESSPSGTAFTIHLPKS
ncbi:two-component system, OmpR family, phosphate regulon sensor histidine kinase PhoR [Reichenbachiella faecimaris]|uniref:histidine kinase n=1 Tax=Reichenbachiella faecimaris TaxID=692418 RepID=A0A1W2GH25_REIFA|nr:HAMP domain-containing sensor histidine kinase [Reichenbachiella faecimaris]SMD35834.1 two-component system, OmpR family, phosphate regulon sensor histidine kinase PhoR [Reichenbachiella faecimaris]